MVSAPLARPRERAGVRAKTSMATKVAMTRKAKPPGRMPNAPGRLLQQLQHALRQRVRLRHHGRAGLLQDLGARQGRGFCGKVGVLNPAAQGGQILCRGLQAGHHRREAVLVGAQRRASR